MKKESIFVSYSHYNQDPVMELIRRMREDGLSVWYYEKAQAGYEWSELLAHKIEECHILLAFISREYVVSQNCLDEIYYAKRIGKNILLLYLDDVELTEGMTFAFHRKSFLMRQDYESQEDFLKQIYESQGFPRIEKSKDQKESSVEVDNPSVVNVETLTPVNTRTERWILPSFITFTAMAWILILLLFMR